MVRLVQFIFSLCSSSCFSVSLSGSFFIAFMMFICLFFPQIGFSFSIFGDKQPSPHKSIQESNLKSTHVSSHKTNYKIEPQKREKKVIRVCFTPGQDCPSQLLQTIRQAKTKLLVHAYSFTSQPLAQALVQAHKQGVVVKVILDKSHCKDKHSLSGYLIKNGISVWIDAVSGIAHNTILIADEQVVTTGSLHFTPSTRNRNAEDLIFIREKRIVREYLQNWHTRLKQSIPLRNYCKLHKLSYPPYIQKHRQQSHQGRDRTSSFKKSKETHKQDVT